MASWTTTISVKACAPATLDRAFRLLAERYRGPVFRVCYAVLPEPRHRRGGDAGDVRQGVSQAAPPGQRRLGQGLPPAHRPATPRSTSSARPGAGATSIATTATPRGGVVTAPAPGLEAAEVTALLDCLDALEPATRTALLLHHWEDRSWHEIAEAVKLPIDTIRMRATRVLRDLLACLAGKGVAP
jgi:hypothetical protein